MSRTIYYTACSLDGFIADSNHSLEWLFQFGDIPPDVAEFTGAAGALAMGSSTYQWLLDNHIFASDPPAAWPYSQPAWVFSSRTLRSLPGANLRFVSGDVRPVHSEMTAAAAGRNVWIVGGGELAGQFLDHRLLDEIVVQIAGVTLVKGAPLLPRRLVTPPLRLLEARRLGTSDLAELRYEIVKTST